MSAINIGGGRKFSAKGWVNLDNIEAANNPKPFVLSPECVLPADNASLDIVYSSHTLEHLDDPTVSRVLDESRRVLKPTGTLLIKIPDFDAILVAYQKGDAGYFARWPNIHFMTKTIGSRGVKDSLAARAAQCFCGFWNKKFGHMYNGRTIDRPGAYYGPPVMTEAELQTAMGLPTPHAVASTLRAHVVAHESDYMFNHQNAWGREEFGGLLVSHGFLVTDCDSDRIIAAHGDVPQLGHQREISAYYTATI